MSDVILLDRLLENANIDMSRPFVWDDQPVSIQDVKDFLSTGNNGTNVPYGDDCKHRTEQKDKAYHVSKVAYFVQHPDEICNIDIDNLCIANHITPTAIITDGWHRLMAAYILNFKTIDVRYGGRIDVLKYLQGLCDGENLVE